MQVRKEVQAVILNEENKILLVKKLDLKNYTYRWRLLKGGVEGNETEEQALRREIEEEIGLKKLEIGEKIFEYDFIFQKILHKVFSFIVKADSTEKIKLQTKEIVDSVWIPKEQAIKMLYWKNEKEAVRHLK